MSQLRRRRRSLRDIGGSLHFHSRRRRWWRSQCGGRGKGGAGGGGATGNKPMNTRLVHPPRVGRATAEPLRQTRGRGRIPRGALHARLRRAGRQDYMAGGTAHAPGHALPNAERRAQAWPMWLALASCFRVCQNARTARSPPQTPPPNVPVRATRSLPPPPDRAGHKTWPRRPVRLARCFGPNARAPLPPARYWPSSTAGACRG